MRTKGWMKRAGDCRNEKGRGCGCSRAALVIGTALLVTLGLSVVPPTFAQGASVPSSADPVAGPVAGPVADPSAETAADMVRPAGRAMQRRAAVSRRFLAGRTGTASGGGMAAARGEHAAMLKAGALQPRLSALNVSWAPVGPGQIDSIAYGKISGRVSSIAIDPGDRTGNTLYIGTTGGGVWKSTNAAGAEGSVRFDPLTDTLPVFSGTAGSWAVGSLSIGAISAQAGGVVLAGTGDPNDASDSYYGTGILRSTDGGVTWTLIQGSVDEGSGAYSFVGLGFAGFAWSSADPNLVVAAVSDSAEGTVVNALRGNSVKGLYVSSDAGLTWRMASIFDGVEPVQTPLTAGGGVGVAATAVVWNPVRQRFYAAIRSHGYYESSDGISWTRLVSQPGAGMTVAACPTASGSAMGTSCPVYRGALAVQSETGDTFALTVDRNNVDQGLWQDVCGLQRGGCTSGAVRFSRRIGTGSIEAGGGSTVIPQADYSLSLGAVPSGTDTLIFVGTGDLYRCSLASGCVLRNTTNATNACVAPAKVAPAQHAIATLSSSTLVYVGNDGGLWRSTDNVGEDGPACSVQDSKHFQNLNSGIGSLAEVISFAQHPEDRSSLLAGLGANGTVSFSGNSGSAWQQVSGGEGGTVAIDQTNPMLWYISGAGGVSVKGCASGSNCGVAEFSGSPTIGSTQVSGDASVVDTPWLLDPAASTNLVIGTCRVWRGSAQPGALWSNANQISMMLGGPQNSTCDPATNPFVRSLAVGGAAISSANLQSSGSKVMYAGMAGVMDGGRAFGGHVFGTANADVASSKTRWLDLAGSPVTNAAGDRGVFNPGGFDISAVATDPHDATGRTVYATVMGFGGNGISAPHLYGSTDGGAHWLNLTSNLPNAPANSVVVDPNDPNTVYVALDTGVYVTTQVTSCPKVNCWSVFGVSLPNAPVVQLLAGTKIPTGDGRTGMLRAATYGRGIWELPLLTATSPARPAITLSGSSLVFPEQAVGTSSPAQLLTVTNSGDAPLALSRVETGTDFTAAGSCAGTTVGTGASCSLQVRFFPSAVGLRTGKLTVYANVSGGQAAVALQGTGTPPGDIILTPLSLSFPNTTVGGASNAQNISIANVGGSSTSLSVPSVTGDFRISANTCGTTLAAETACAVSVIFAPTAGGARSGTLVVTRGSGTSTASLTGTGSKPATDSLSMSAINFGSQQIGAASAPQQLVLTNAGDTPLTLISAQITSGEFTAVNGCGSSLSGRSSCAITVSFAPRSVGMGSGTLVVSDQFRSQSVSLSGTGVAPPGVSLSPAGSVGFPATAVGMRSPAQTITLTNNGGLPLSFQAIALSGDFTFVQGGSCGTVLPQGAACSFVVVFAPTTGGARSGSLAITTNAPNSPHTVTLLGSGIDFTLAASGSTSASIASGKTAVYPLLLSSAPGTTGTAALACTGAPANATCVVSPGNAPFGSAGVASLVTVTVQTGVASAVARGKEAPGRLGGVGGLFVAGLVPFGLLVVKKWRVTRVAGLLGLVCVLGAGGCGPGRQIPLTGGSTPGTVSTTPPGTYALTVTASSSGLTRSVGLNLTVQ